MTASGLWFGFSAGAVRSWFPCDFSPRGWQPLMFHQASPSAIVPAGDVSMEKSKDQDRGKGAMEQDQEKHGGNTSMQGQLGHRDEDVELKDADSNLAG